MSYLKSLFQRFFCGKDPVETYLAQAVDHADLERRLKDIQMGRVKHIPYI